MQLHILDKKLADMIGKQDKAPQLSIFDTSLITNNIIIRI